MGNAQRQLVAAIHLPRVPGFSVSADQDFHQIFFGCLGRARRRQRTGFHFVVVAVPEFFLIGRQRFEDLRADDVFHTDQSRIFLFRVIQDALQDFVAQMRAIVLRDELAFHIAAVEMNAANVRPNRANRCEIGIGLGAFRRSRCFRRRLRDGSYCGDEKRCDKKIQSFHKLFFICEFSWPPSVKICD